MPVIHLNLPQPLWEKLTIQAQTLQQPVQEVILTRLRGYEETGERYQRFCRENPDLFITVGAETLPPGRPLSAEERATLAEKAGRGKTEGLPTENPNRHR